MKKSRRLVAVIISVIMLAAVLSSCGNNNDSSPVSADAGSAANAPEQNTADTAPPSSNSGASPSDSTVAPPSTVTTAQAGVGYYTDDFDPFSREKYRIAYIDIMLTPFSEITCQVWSALGEYLNYEFTYFSANSDEDYFVATIEDLSRQGYNGLIFNGDATDCVRHQEVADEVGIVWLPFLSTYVYENGMPSHPSAVLNGGAAGAEAADWAIDNFAKYNGYEPEWADIGVITICLSVSLDMQTRADGFKDQYSKRFPELADTNFFAVDTLPGGVAAWVSAQGAYDLSAPIVAAHPEFEGWLIFGAIENYSSGAQTLLTEYEMTGTSIVVGIHASMMMDEYDQGIMTCWRASIDLSQQDWGAFIIHGLLAMIDGRATPETLWEDYKNPGDTYATVNLPFTIITYENYKDYQVYLANYIAERYA